MRALLSWMEHSALHDFLVDSAWAFPAFEIAHFIGLILLFGSVAFVDLRLLGVGAAIPLRACKRILAFAALGFFINMMSGTMFLFSDPYRYLPNLAFRLKVVAIIVAGVNAIWFFLAIEPQLRQDREPGLHAKATAVFSLLLWSAVIVLGRSIPYLE